MLKLKENIIAQYTLGTLLVTCIFSIALSGSLSRWSIESQIAHHIELYPELVNYMVETSPGVKDFLLFPDKSKDEGREEVENFFDNLKSFGSIFRLKAWSEDGRIIWSDSNKIIGKKFPDNSHFQRAWQGEINYAIGKPHKQEHQNEMSKSTILEIYTPIMIEGKVIAVIEIYEAADELFEQIRINKLYIYALIGFASAILYGLLFVVFFRAHKHQKNICQQLIKTQDGSIISLASLAEARDNETGDHLRRTQRYMKSLAEQLQDEPIFRDTLTRENIEILFKSAPLHDIGKVGVKDAILLKPGKLTPEEFEQMKKHTVYGMNALEEAIGQLGSNSFLRFAEEITYTHHEKWDGTGYPNGLSGHEIPVSGLIMAVADVYDALISKRSYKPSFSHEEAVETISKGKGTHFCPVVVDAFLSCSKDFRDISIKYADHG